MEGAGTEDSDVSAEGVRAAGGERGNGPRHRSRSGRGRARPAPGRAGASRRGRAPGRRRAPGVGDAASAARPGSPGPRPSDHAQGALGRASAGPGRSVIYLDSSVALVHLLVEDRVPPAALWAEPLVSSRLLEYELWTRIHARRLGDSHGDMVRALLGRVALLELAAPVLARALEPFPIPVRTLDAFHLASLEFFRSHGQTVRLASYDERLLSAARRLGVEVHTL